MGKRIYSLEFRREAVRKAMEPGANLSQIAREIGIKQQTLHRWKRSDGRLPSDRAGAEKPASSELEKLRRDNIKLRAERDILKKALGYFAKEPT
jgi:transposase